MRHVTLTCLHHPNLRWSCKEIAVGDNGAYNGMRSIFFVGAADGPLPKDEHGNEYLPYVGECSCPAADLRFAPEEIELQKTEPLERSAA